MRADAFTDTGTDATGQDTDHVKLFKDLEPTERDKTPSVTTRCWARGTK